MCCKPALLGFRGALQVFHGWGEFWLMASSPSVYHGFFADDAVQKSPFSFFSTHLSHLCQRQPLGAMQQGHGAERPILWLWAGTAHLSLGNSLSYCSQNRSPSSVLLNIPRHSLTKHSLPRAWAGAPGRNVTGVILQPAPREMRLWGGRGCVGVLLQTFGTFLGFGDSMGSTKWLIPLCLIHLVQVRMPHAA